MTTFVLSCVNAGFLHLADQGIVIGLAVFYGGIAQFCAGMWEFKTGNTFGAVAFTSFGAFWLSFAAIFIPFFGVNLGAVDAKTGAATGPGLTAVGYYLIGWAIFTGIMTIASIRIHGALFVLFLLLFVTYILLAMGFLGVSGDWIKYGGFLGIIVAIIAWYIALEGVLAGVSGGKWKLPTFPLFRA